MARTADKKGILKTAHTKSLLQNVQGVKKFLPTFHFLLYHLLHFLFVTITTPSLFLSFSLSLSLIWIFFGHTRVYKGIYFIKNTISYPYQNINQEYFWFGFLCAFDYAIYLNQTIKTPMYIHLYANLHIEKSHSKSILLLLLIFMLMYNIYTSAKSNIIHLF